MQAHDKGITTYERLPVQIVKFIIGIDRYTANTSVYTQNYLTW